MKFYTAVVFALAMCLYIGAEVDEHHEHHEHADGRAVEVSREVQKSLGLKTKRVEKRRLGGMMRLTGRYELAPEARRSSVSPVSGRLSLQVKPFSKVVGGEVLFTVSAPELVAKAHEIELLEKRLAVYRELKTPNAMLENELAVKKSARAALLAGAEEKDGKVVVRAQMDGVVEALPATDGSWLEVGTEVVRLVRPEALRLKALVSAAEVVRLKDGLKCQADGVCGELRIGLDAESGLVPVYVVFAQGVPRGRVGARGMFTCETDSSAVASIVVPRAAIVRVGLKSAVFVRDEHDEDRFLALEVIPGETVGGWTAVKGLPEDDDLEVVVEGAYELKLALAAGKSAPAGHFHADGSFHEGED